MLVVALSVTNAFSNAGRHQTNVYCNIYQAVKIRLRPSRPSFMLNLRTFDQYFRRQGM